MNPEFWNARYGEQAYAYGTAPNRFLAEAVPRFLSPPATLLELGAGEGRNAVYFAQQGYRVTALDYAEEGLAKARRLADTFEVNVETVLADVTAWETDRRWDGVVVSFLHLPEAGRIALFERVKGVLSPGGVFFAEWFRPEQVTGGYRSGGPPAVVAMVTKAELAEHFKGAGLVHLESTETILSEGPHHEGPAAVVRLIWRKT